MSLFFSMLRGINVSGKNRILMADLKALYEGLGFTDVQTYVQSGNVLFNSAKGSAAGLGAAIESQISKTFGFSVPVVIRSPKELQKALAGNPFLNGRSEDPARLYVTFLAAAPSKAALAGLEIPSQPDDEFIIRGREVFLFCPAGYGQTKLTNNLFEKKLGVTATTRNWNTVNALYAMAMAG
jgi:uncharacterized protein (DUF1697 family)